MKAEFVKFRSLRVMKVLLAVVAVSQLLFTIWLAVKNPDNGTYYANDPSTLMTLIGGICAVVAGMSVIGVEYSQKTLQRTLSAIPQRSRVLAAKLTVALVVAGIGFTAVFLLFGLINTFLIQPATVENAASLADLLKESASLVLTLSIFSVVGFGFTLLTRSSAAGVCISLSWIFIVDSVAAAFQPISHYTFSVSLSRVLHSLSSGLDDTTSISFTQAFIQLSIYLLLITVPGWVRFSRGDLK